MKSKEQLEFIKTVNKILNNSNKKKYKALEKVLLNKNKILNWEGIITNVVRYSRKENIEEVFLMIDINNEYIPNIVFHTLVKEQPYLERDIQNLKTSSLVKFSGKNFSIKCYNKNYLIIHFEPLEINEIIINNNN